MHAWLLSVKRNSSAFGFLLRASSHTKTCRVGLILINHYVLLKFCSRVQIIISIIISSNVIEKLMYIFILYENSAKNNCQLHIFREKMKTEKVPRFPGNFFLFSFSNIQFYAASNERIPCFSWFACDSMDCPA